MQRDLIPPHHSLLLMMVAGMLLARGAGAGVLLEESFFGPITQRTIQYNIYLPDGYETGSERYPVVYHLHGLGGSQGGTQNALVPASFAAARQAGLIGPVIIVFPNGCGDSMWADSWDGAKPAETNLVHELVPHVDATYRTIPHRGQRVIAGFSMGGFGAVKFAAKFPDHFAICVAYDGAFLTWDQLRSAHPEIASGIFMDSEANFDAYSPWTYIAANASVLRDSSHLRLVVGSLIGYNRPFRDLLLDLGIAVFYVETGCAHSLPCLLEAEGLNSAAFIRTAMVLATAVEAGTPPAPTLSLWAAPNPARDRIRIGFELPVPGTVSLIVFDAVGRERALPIRQKPLSAGAYQVELDTRAWPAGIYFCRLDAGASGRLKLAIAR